MLYCIKCRVVDLIYGKRKRGVSSLELAFTSSLSAFCSLSKQTHTHTHTHTYIHTHTYTHTHTHLHIYTHMEKKQFHPVILCTP